MASKRNHRSDAEPPPGTFARSLQTALVCCGCFWIPLSGAAPLHLAVLGDSLSAEYDSISGIAGVDDPTEYAAITVPGWEAMSWVEVLGRLRPVEIDLGGYRTDLLGWGVFRFSGYEYNFAIPGFEASHFEQIVNSSILSDPQFLPYKQQIADVLRDQADAAVVWLGGNEFRANYGYLYDGNDPSPLVHTLSNHLAQILDFVRAQKPGIQLVVANLPDLGAAPDKQSAHPDPAKRANVTTATMLANAAISSLAQARGIPVANIFPETQKLVLGETVWIGPVDLFPGSQPDNHPRYQFTRDGLHPNSCLQAILARRMIDAFNQSYSASVPQLTDAEVLSLIGLDPLQTYRDWVSTNALTATGPGEDPDADGWVNLAEFVLQLDPSSPDTSPLTIEAAAPLVSVRYHADPDRQRLVEVRPEWSSDLPNWESVPAEWQTATPDGAVTIALPAGETAGFVRLRVSLRT